MPERVRNAFTCQLQPTPDQARALGETLWRCRSRYNTALEERITASRRRGVTLTCSQQQAELPDLKAGFPAYTAIHSHALQDVPAHLEKTYQAFFRRLRAGQRRAFPRFQGRNRSHSFTDKKYGNRARLDNGFLVLSKIGRIAVRWSRPLEGTPKSVTISKEVDG
jgi:putative transposase